MGMESESNQDEVLSRGMEVLQRNRGWFLALGIGLIILGVVAICVPFVATMAIELLLGWIFLIRGVVQGVYAFQSRKWGGFFLRLVTGVLGVVVGILLLVAPLRGILALTLLLALFILIEGVFKIILAVQLRPFPNRGWMVFSGIIDLVLAVLIWAEWPSSAGWVLGVLVGINMIFGGLAIIMFAMAARAATQEES